VSSNTKFRFYITYVVAAIVLLRQQDFFFSYATFRSREFIVKINAMKLS